MSINIFELPVTFSSRTVPRRAGLLPSTHYCPTLGVDTPNHLFTQFMLYPHLSEIGQKITHFVLPPSL